MATIFELKRDYGWKYALKEAWEELKWYKFDLYGWITALFRSYKEKEGLWKR